MIHHVQFRKWKPGTKRSSPSAQRRFRGLLRKLDELLLPSRSSPVASASELEQHSVPEQPFNTVCKSAQNLPCVNQETKSEFADMCQKLASTANEILKNEMVRITHEKM
eukprot:Gregarina_sp_Poly_1__1300@NODE_131_length_13241_cov_228_075983_g117_i0_p8_GENE_NODE_131_length_13241_cov_228_075983_g117_i0NODE_131_length_13241_cov_228_075983_g117_i0_p8_ORF_typecomplete_len109_score13_54Cdc6_C/PF09079_11/2_4e02Cdc6_C/PF09079_11/1_8_NODE_131_length_13241_cov_228_075983_g117_i082578583